MAATASERRMQAQLAANTRWAMTVDRSAATQRARDARLAKYEAKVDPHGELSPTVRRERAIQLRKADMQRLALASAKARAAA